MAHFRRDAHDPEAKKIKISTDEVVRLANSFDATLNELKHAVIENLGCKAEVAPLSWTQKGASSAVGEGPTCSYKVDRHMGPNGLAYLVTFGDERFEDQTHMMGFFKDIEIAKIASQRHSEVVNSIGMSDLSTLLIQRAFVDHIA
jgi:hypothetical protein